MCSASSRCSTRDPSGSAFTPAVFELDRPSLAAVLRGLFTADGTVANYGEKSQYVALDSTSLELLAAGPAPPALVRHQVEALRESPRRHDGGAPARRPAAARASTPSSRCSPSGSAARPASCSSARSAFIPRAPRPRRCAGSTPRSPRYHDELTDRRRLHRAGRRGGRLRPHRARDASLRRERPRRPQLLRVHVPRRHRLQPRVDQPGEVPARGRRASTSRASATPAGSGRRCSRSAC